MPLTVITGGTRGIGAAVARRLAREGHDLVLGFAGDEAAAEQTAAAVAAEGVRCVTVRADLTTGEGVERIFARAEEIDRITGLVNNAGTTFCFAPLAETSTEIVRDTIDLNLTAAVLCARAAVRAMTTAPGVGGVIVNISSGAATLGSPGEYVYYAAAKAGVDALTLGLSKEVADAGIRVVGVAPGLIETTLHERTGDPDRLERMAPQVPLGRAGRPEEIADAVAFLMSDQAAYITGTTLRVAGGR